MTSIPEPDEEPGTDGRSEEHPDPVAREDAAWAAIIANYGDRATIEEPQAEPEPEHRQDTEPDSGPGAGGAADFREDGEDQPGGSLIDHEEHFVPPPPPPLPSPPPARLAAWVGLFGVPTFILVALVAGLSLPSWLSLVLMVWFVGGFVFLVASMKPRTHDGPDDGARL